MSLPLPWVDRIFDKLTLTYGQAFLARWRDLDLNAVKSDWMHELAGFEGAPHAIAHALSNLPERPPTVLEFRSICRSAPAKEVPRLDAPPADPARVAVELAKLRELSPLPVTAGSPNIRWAHAIMARIRSGDRTVTPTAATMARAALNRCGAEA